MCPEQFNVPRRRPYPTPISVLKRELTTAARPKVAGKVMVNVSKIIVISNIVVSAAVASVQSIFQTRCSIHRGRSKKQCGTRNSRRIEEDANRGQNCDYRGGFSDRLNV
jgi:hypothetical protein